MNEGDADCMAEKPEPPQKAATGSCEDMGRVRQAFTAMKGEASLQEQELMERIVGRENLRRALKRVRANKGAPGTDGMTILELAPYLKSELAAPAGGVAKRNLQA